MSSDVVLRSIDDFKKEGISFLDKLSEPAIVAMLIKTNEVYRNLGPDEEPLITDTQYDILEDYIKRNYPKNKTVDKIGAPVEKNKATLPYKMPSMDKIKPDTAALTAWKAKYKGPYVLSCKLDGVSGLYSTEHSKSDSKGKLYTRGDGTTGQDISHFIKYLNLPTEPNIVVRGEFILKKSVFTAKYASRFANGRNLVAGTINRLSVTDVIKDIDFVAYELIVPSLKPSEQMAKLKTLGFNIVQHETRSDITNEMLSELLVNWRKNYAYEIDGIIVSDDHIYPRQEGNPDHSFAFKMVLSDQMAEAKVVDVLWSASKDGYLKPRVQIEPVQLCGVNIEYTTGFNAAFIETNKIGVGAVIQIIRSGDVIPYIKAVVTPADRPLMPTSNYQWNDTHVDIVLEDLSSDVTVVEKNITGFFKGIEVDGLSGGNVKKIVGAGYNTVPKILNMTKSDFLKIEGFKDKMATKLFEGIKDKVDKASISDIMAASNMFGRGFSDKKIALILEEYPDILISKASAFEKITRLASTKGMATKTAEAFVEHIPTFLDFLKECGLQSKLPSSTVLQNTMDTRTSHPLYKKSIVMSGSRDNTLERVLETLGAKIGSSVSKNTFTVITPDVNSDTGKVGTARQLGVPILTPEEFKQKYGI